MPNSLYLCTRFFVKLKSSFQKYMHPSILVLIKYLQSKVSKRPVVVSPHVVLDTKFPLSISKIDMYLSLEAAIRKVPDLSRVTTVKS